MVSLSVESVVSFAWNGWSICRGITTNLSEVVRAGIRLLMEKDNARQFYALKVDLEEALREAEAGGFEVFDPQAYEPNAGTRPL